MPDSPCDPFVATFALAAVGIAHVGLDGRWLRVNRTCCEITGCTEEELLQGRFQEITHPDDLGSDLENIERLLSGKGRHYSMEKRYVRRDGSLIWVNLSVTLVSKPDGAPDFFISLITDISRAKALEADLIASEARYRSIFDAAVEAMAVIDHQGSIQSVNPAVERIFGYQPEELVGRNIKVLLPRAIAAKHDGYLERYRRTGVPGIIGKGRDVEGRRKDGTLVALDLSVAQWTHDDRTYFTGTMRDVSKRRATEAALLQSRDDLQSLQTEYAHLARVTEMGEMASAIAHEINQPLTAIANNLNAGLYAIEACDAIEASAEARIVMKAAADQAIRAGLIIRRLREFVGKTTGERRLEAITPLIEAARDLALIDAPAHGIEVEMADDGQDLHATIDAIQLKQVLVNLLRNAVDALLTLPKGAQRKIRIATGLSDIAGQFHITLSDTGPGIPDRLRQSIFEPFFTSKSHGMGMGLSVCQRLVEAHGGTIMLEPTKLGASFRVSLPLDR
ncbi:PAS domain S-box protein [Sphingomonas sp. HF-S4]|uniref:histidine kinase n=1 Tax=Sphingomonas agrestis TaxID=3080540 RepID=A0ABU3Y693_9SPHN|nr:PAS domain S-box protein [Sphingomonas sp. HF-S4]MDV3456836.1 PAS domain S-box protein [Sphingomonas sp. HF-S4]